MNLRNLSNELKRRSVYKVAVAYGVVAWFLIQVSDIVFPRLHLPDWAVTLVIVMLMLGFPVALLLAWAFELTPEGVKRTEEVGPHESLTHHPGRRLIVGIVLVAALALGLLLFQLFQPKPGTGQAVSPAAAGPGGIPEKASRCSTTGT